MSEQNKVSNQNESIIQQFRGELRLSFETNHIQVSPGVHMVRIQHHINSVMPKHFEECGLSETLSSLMSRTSKDWTGFVSDEGLELAKNGYLPGKRYNHLPLYVLKPQPHPRGWLGEMDIQTDQWPVLRQVLQEDPEAVVGGLISIAEDDRVPRSFMLVDGKVVPTAVRLSNLMKKLRTIKTAETLRAAVNHLLDMEDTLQIGILLFGRNHNSADRLYNQILSSASSSNSHSGSAIPFLWRTPSYEIWNQLVQMCRSKGAGVEANTRQDIDDMMNGRPLTHVTMKNMEKAIMEMDLLGLNQFFQKG